MIRYVGTCPVCEGHFKVTPDGRMVLHGYKRPGTGYVIGDCFGVGRQPYEISSAGCAAYRDQLALWRAGFEASVREYEARPKEIDYYSKIKRQQLVYRRDSEDPIEQGRYENALRSAIAAAQSQIMQINFADRRMAQLIARWAPAPLLEIDEEGRTAVQRGERDARKAERDAQRAAKAQKRAEATRRKNERLARKAEALLFFYDSFESLRGQPATPARLAYARDLLFEAAKKKHGISYPSDLFSMGFDLSGPWSREMRAHAERTLVELGVARQETTGTHTYVSVAPVYSSQGNKITVPTPRDPEETLTRAASRRPPS